MATHSDNPCLRCPIAEECEMYDRYDDWFCMKDFMFPDL